MEEIEDIIKDYKNNIYNKEENFEKLERYYRTTIYKVIYTTTTEKERIKFGIEDFYQEGLIILLKCLDKFKLDQKVKFRTYLYTSIRNRIINIKLSKQMKQLLLTEFQE